MVKTKYIATIRIWTVLLVFLQADLVAQSTQANPSPVVIGAAGGNAVRANLSLEWTLGEAFVESVIESDKWYTQGFHQPFLKVHPDRSNKPGSLYKIQVSPNPTPDRLTISIQTSLEESIWLRVVDVTGRTIIHQRVSPKTVQVELSLKNLSDGLYLLSIVNPTGYRIDSFKVIKQ